MDIGKRLLRKNSLEKLVEQLHTEGTHVYAPVLKGKIVDFKNISSIQEMTDDYIVTRRSAKFASFPRVEKLLSFQTDKQGVKSQGTDTALIPEIVLLGTRPCDAIGFDSLTSIFNWDYKDDLYNERLGKTTIIGMSCSKSDDYCFCTSVNGNPGNTKGSDILLTQFETGDYLAEIVTEKGNTFVNKYANLFEGDPGIEKEKYIAKVEKKFDEKEVIEHLSKIFENEIWLEQSLRCLGCGACAFVCPTCACFDIQDETNLRSGKRFRSWDSCGFSLFTLHTSGHNPREVQSKRWRQRIMHKFSYMPERLNIVGCVGCGRCSRACPVDMNISEHITKIAEVVI